MKKERRKQHTDVKRTAELLAPAGGMDELKAAVSAGADAVYLGGRMFNARMNAGNFDDEELAAAVRYAHLRGVKVYVTMNTLLYDDELAAAVRYAAFLYETGVDALIIQDLGLGYLVRKYIHDFEIHLSTQGTVYNASGARMAQSLGYSRVVCAREMSLDEIREMSAVCETEVFVHGAICMCYSGQCQLSRSIGGRSGNRGQCAQPCRLMYEDEKGEKGYWLSPKDLCLIDRLGDLIDAGVASFKIEGRMKSPEYVAVVTGIYRKYIDAYIKEGSYRVSPEDRRALMQIFSRGRFTEGYLDGQPVNFLSGDLPKHQGILTGHVLGRGPHDLVRVFLTDELEMGDGVEIRGGSAGIRKPAGNIVTYIERLGNGSGFAGKGGAKKGSGEKQKKNTDNSGEYMIGDIRGDLRSGDLVYRISSRHQLEEARLIAAGDLKKIPVQMKFFAIPGKEASLTVSCGGRDDPSGRSYFRVSVCSENVIEPANNRPADEEFVKDKLSKTGDTVYETERTDVKLAGDCYLSASMINHMRRKALDQLDDQRMCTKRSQVILPDDLETQLPGRLKKKQPVSEDHAEKDFAVILPEITKGRLDAEIKKKIAEGAFDGKNVMVNNLGWIMEFRQHNTAVYGGRGLNVMNGAAEEVLGRAGVIVSELSRELEEVPERLMITEYDLPQKTLKDGRGRVFYIEKENGKTIIRK